MTSPAARRSILPGLFLIFLGLYLLAQKLDWVDLDWIHIYPVLLLFAGARSFMRYRQFSHSNSLFNTVFLATLGGFFLIRNYELIPFWPIETAWPIFLIAAGFGFLAMYLRHSQNVFDFIFGGMLTALGLIIFFNNLNLIRAQFLVDLWPIIFIIIGIMLIRNSLQQKKQKEYASKEEP
ncbi:MAG: DUF5668 domain-containing protein [candidate division KSB1 bacterium]|nr:DUF5668 domain-containing protein [candidate division KSB1 bacterium]